MKGVLLFKITCLLIILFLSTFAHGKEEIRFGVFAYLGYEKTKERYEPLIEYLNTKLDKKVILEVLNQEDMDLKIKNKELDIATTNPTHFLVIRQNTNLSGAIATLMEKGNGKPINSLAGVIVVRKDSPINSIKDIKNKKIATPSLKHMGGFRAQAYEFYKNNQDAIKENEFVYVNIHQEGIHKILKNEVDVAFVRDGIYEKMLANKTLDANDVKIINEQKNSNHPFKISTTLYPEWPLFALPNANKEDVKKILSALFSFDSTSIYAQKSGIYGYDLPADYLIVEALARALRLPPYESIGVINYSDMIEQYKIELFCILLFFIIMGAYSIKMKKQNTFVESLLANIGEGVYGVNNNGICTWMNQKALNMLGLKKNEIIGFNQHYIFHHHTVKDNEYSEKDCPIYQTIKDKQTRNCLEHFIKKDGSFFPVKLTVATAGNYGAVVIFSDFTEIKNYESKLEYEVYNKTQELQELNMTLENKIHEALEKNKKQQALLEHQSRLAALGEMIGNIAHQWRQPLSVITTSISGLRIKQEMGMEMTTESISQTADTIISHANYLSKTIDDFRDFIKNDNKKEIFNLLEVINNTINILNATLKSNHINLILNLDNTISYDGYPNQLSQVILNIVNNAKDALQEKNQNDKQIEIKTTKNETTIKIEISDNAGGINEEIKNKIFDPYFTTKHQSKGTGLGLYICANLIKKDFAGLIYAENIKATINETSYKGTKFVIELPLSC